MSPDDLLRTAAVALLVGTLIGGIGVGGVLMAPWLIQVIGLPTHAALAIAMLGFALPGALALVMASRSMRGLRRADWRLVLATIPGALAGSAALSVLSERLVLGTLATALVVVGLRLILPARAARSTQQGEAARARGASGDPDARIGNGTDDGTDDGTSYGNSYGAGFGTGFGTGLASALTGTGGPMVLTPWLLWRGVPLTEAVVLGQIVQLPIAATATAGNLLAGTVDVAAGLAIGLMLLPGLLIGQRLVRRLPQRLLSATVGWLLLGAAGSFVLKAL